MKAAPKAFDDLCVVVLALAVYLATLAPTVPTGDSGELITAAATLSLAHPTGYPLYLLLGHAFIRVFGFLSPAVAMNLFSALAALGACLVVRRLALELTRDRIAAVATALLFAFSASMWSQATVARVYALGALLLALSLLELVRLREGTGGSLSRASLWFGLGMANHTVTIVLAPLLVIAALRFESRWTARIKAALWSLPGVALYAYIPIAAASNPIQNWGDPTSWDRLLAYLTRESFWSKRYVDQADDLWQVAAHYLDRIPLELSWAGVALLLFGVAVGVQRKPWVVGLGLYLFVTNLALMALHGSRQDVFHWSRYMITGWLGLVLIAGLGLQRVLEAFERPALRISVATLVPALVLGLGYPRADRSADTWAHDFGVRLLENLEPGAMLFSEEDNVVFPLSYLHHVEGLRPDVELVMQGINQLDSLAIQPDRRPTYFTHPRGLGASALELVPDGLAFRVMLAGSGFTGRSWQSVALDSFESIDAPEQDRYLDRSLVGNYYFLKALNLEQRDAAAAMEAVRRLRTVSFDNAVNQVNAGLLFERNLRFEEAFDAFDTAAAIDPSNDLAVSRARFWRATLDRASAVANAEQRSELIAGALVDTGRADLALRVLRGAAPAD